jgi:hypothetical protein
MVAHEDPLKDGKLALRTALIDVSVHALCFQRAKEALYHSVIVAVAFAAHAHLDVKLLCWLHRMSILKKKHLFRK